MNLYNPENRNPYNPDIAKSVNLVYASRTPNVPFTKSKIYNPNTKRTILQSGKTGTAYMTKNKLTRIGTPTDKTIPIFIDGKRGTSKGWVIQNYKRVTPITLSKLTNAILSKITPNMKDLVVSIAATDSEEFPFYRSIKMNAKLLNKNVLLNKINKIQVNGGGVAGSDAFEEGTELNTTFFQLKYKQRNVRGHSGRKDLKVLNTEYFKCVSYPSEHGDCLLAILKKNKHIAKIREDLGLKGGIKVFDIPKLEDYFKININVYNDVVVFDRVSRDTNKSNFTKTTYEYEYYYKSEAKNNNEINILLKDEHYSEIVEFKDLIFDPTCGDRLKIVKGIPKPMCDLAKRKSLIRQGRTIAGTKKEEDETITKLLFFDIETVFNPDSLDILEPYSVAWHIASSDKPVRFTEKNIDKYTEETFFYRGKGCMTRFVRWIEDNSDGVNYILIGYNNSRFDNFPLLKSVIGLDLFTSMRFVQNSILPLRFGQRHVTFDLCRFVMSPLKDACNSFNTYPKKLDGFSHYEPQNKFMAGGWDSLNTWMDDNLELLVKYNKYDVLSTENLFYIVRKAYSEILETDILDYSTLAQLTYDCFKTNIKPKFKLPPPKTHGDDKFIRNAIVGGRCQDFKAIFNKNDELACGDVKSLYPTMMMERDFPIEDYVYTKKYDDRYLGIYSITILEQPSPNIIPFRGEDNSLDWEYRGEIEKIVVSSIDIECLKRHGAKIIFEPMDSDDNIGMCWKKSTSNLFTGYLKPIKDEKTKQDNLSAAKSSEYNPALRNITKLLLNSLSGKFVQRNFEDTTQMVKNSKEEEKLAEKTISLTPEMIIGDYRLLSGELKASEQFKKSAKPSYIGIFIYSYARSYMYDLIYSNYKLLYTDTDSAILLKADYDDFKNKHISRIQSGNKVSFALTDNENDIPTIGGEFGQFEEEFDGDGKLFESYIIGKKIYCVEMKDKDGNISNKSKYRMKGVNLKNSRVISSSQANEVFAMKKLKDRSRKIYALKQKLDNEYDELTELNKKILNIDIFRDLSKGCVYFLCGQLKKKNCMTIVQSYSIKMLINEKDIEYDLDGKDYTDKLTEIRRQQKLDYWFNELNKLDNIIN